MTLQNLYEENASRSQLWLRMFGFGPTGAGKTKGALRLATTLFGGTLRTTLVNSERGRGSLYADRFAYDLLDLSKVGDFSPETWVAALDICEGKNPGGVYVLDSVTHEWNGKNGILQQADRFGDWKTVRPLHNEFVERILACEAHVIVLCRAKMKYEVSEEERENGRKRQVIVPLGVGPIQDDSLQYEFNLVGNWEQTSHEVRFSGHVDPLIDTVHDLDDDADLADVVGKLERWLSEGDPIEPPEAADEAEVAKLRASLDAEGISAERIERGFAAARRENRGQLHPDYVAAQLAASEDRLKAKRPQTAEPAAT